MNDYYIASDMNGRYAIVHGIEWKNHKYIKKIGEGKGALYFYTLKELQTYLSNVRNRMQKTGESAASAGAKVAQTFAQKGSTALTTAKTTGNRVYGIAKSAANNGVELVKAQAQRTVVPKASDSRQVSNQTVRQAPANRSVQSTVGSAVQAAGKAMTGIRKVADIKAAAVKKLSDAAEKAVGQLRTKVSEFSPKPKQTAKPNGETSEASSSNDAKPQNASASVPAESSETPSSRPTAHQKTVSGSAKEGWSKRRDIPGRENASNPAQDLQEYANALIDSDIQISSDKTGKEQIKEYAAAVDAKIDKLKSEDPASSDQYMKEQLFVIGAMCSGQYYAAKNNYERSTVELEKFAKEVDDARKAYEKANNEFNANKTKMSKEEHTAAKEQLNWKKDMLRASVNNYDQQQALILSYYNDMNFYKEVLTGCTSEIEMLNAPSAVPEPSVFAQPQPLAEPHATLQIDPRGKR